MLDRIRDDIQERLGQLLGEADKLRRALVALGSRDGAASSSESSPEPVPAKAQRRTRSASTSGSGSRKAAIKQPETPAVKRRSRSTGAPGPRARTQSGATKTAVLAALASGEALTAGDVATASGLGRATVSTTLSKLAKTGELTKAERGYRLTESASADASADSAQPSVQPEAAEPHPSEPS